MKPDPEYLRQLLAAFQSAPNPTTDIRQLKAAGVSFDDPRFEFHMMLLKDGSFIESVESEPSKKFSTSVALGLAVSADGARQWSVIPLRLTASGHEFAEAMENSKVLPTLKKNFLGASISTIRDVAVAIIKAEITKRTGLA